MVTVLNAAVASLSMSTTIVLLTLNALELLNTTTEVTATHARRAVSPVRMNMIAHLVAISIINPLI